VADRIPEPPTGAAWYWPPRDKREAPIVAVRDDQAAAMHGRPERRWLLAMPASRAGVVSDTWQGLLDAIAAEGVTLDEAILLLPPTEVEAAVARAQLVPVGAHLKELGGWCRTCSVHHSETEWARIHDQVQREAGDG